MSFGLSKKAIYGAIFAIVIVQIVVIFALTIHILRQINNKKSVQVLTKKDLLITRFDKLEFFYESSPNQTKIAKEAWLKKVYLKEKIAYRINKDSLNEQYDYPQQKPLNTIRVVVIGDSFTYGIYVNTKDNWTELLETSLNKTPLCPNVHKYEVINLGMPGYDVEYALARYKKRGVKYNPDLILYYMKNNDFEEIRQYMYPYKLKYVNLFKKTGVEWILSHFGTLSNNFAYDLAETAYLKQMNLNKSKIEAYQMNVLDDFLSKNKKNILFFNNFELDKTYENFLKKRNNKYGNIYFFDDSNSLFNNPDSKAYTFTPYDNHPNRAGHKVIASDLYKYLSRHKTILCEEN